MSEQPYKDVPLPELVARKAFIETSLAVSNSGLSLADAEDVREALHSVEMTFVMKCGATRNEVR